MPNDQKTIKTNDTQTSTSNVPPILIQEDILPPMPQQTSQTSTVTVEQPKIDILDSGSGAPENDIKIDTVMPAVVTTGPKKKYAGGKIIATILGLFLLVGGLGAGVFLVGQNQNPQEKAGENGCNQYTSSSTCNGSCSPTKGDPPKSYACKWFSASSSCGESSKECSGGGGGGDLPSCSDKQVEDAGLGGSLQYRCSNLGVIGCQKGTAGENTGYICNCIDMSPGTCSFFASQCTTYDTKTCPLGENPPIGNNYCSGTGCSVPVLQSGCYVSHFRSNKKDDLVVNGSDITVNLTAKSAQLGGVSCGAEQIDVNCKYAGYPDCTVSGAHTTGACSVSRRYDTDCGVNPPDLPTTPPTPTAPAITSSCQNIKAYNSTWTELTATQLTALRAGNIVNFCVAGIATGGSFDKAKLTINGVAQAETTLKRPGSDDFCQHYVIPSGTATFNIQAQIHHLTLGWK